MTYSLIQDISKLWRMPVDATAGIYALSGGDVPSGVTHAIAWGDQIPPPNTSPSRDFVAQPPVLDFDTSQVQSTPPPRGIIFCTSLYEAQLHRDRVAAC